MYILVLLIPLLSAMITGCLGRKIGSKGAGVLTSSCISLTVVISGWIFYETVLNGSSTYLKFWKWFDSELLVTDFGLQFDGLTSTMLILITSVSALVHIYSTGYMSDDPHIPRFMSYLSLFTFLMIVLVTSDNYVQLFIGWEGVGLCSYLLINFWLTRIKANKAAIKAMIVNRVGDIGLLLAMFLIIKEFGTLEYSSLSGVSGDGKNLTVICLLLFFGAVGKSAQLGLHTWLPDAMEGPTPVSALIHAATMVTAGVFLIIRSGPLFESSSLVLTIVTFIGALTAFFAATIGVAQNDLKKVIAYSTCSQLGYMVMACGVSNYSASLFHLLNHGFFKALLFLSAGSVIHAVNGEQDIRKMGALIRSIPLTYAMILIGSLSLMGFPYLSGFYSKDLILELTYGKYYIVFAFWLGSLSALLTAFYSVRLIYLTFITNTNASKMIFRVAQESSSSIIFPLLLLAFGSIFVGYFTKEMVLTNSITPIVDNLIKVTPFVLSLLGLLLAFIVPTVVSRPRVLYTFLNSAWQFNFVINNFFVNSIWKFGHLISYRIIDRGLLEFLGPRGMSQLSIRATQGISNLQSGTVFNYALIMIVFTSLFIMGFKLMW